ncbi:alpha/beta fold hydrolase [Alkalihalobacillus deserti]|uniref:alpha/beta fold hydrolase n=1 Tax=Alkalihalobacillus deserti TaxID=2879466 RepID=UPI001D15B174|nr:alpha/beta fold hydrolase [Alkalihalobacillus deserti]
MNGDKIIKEKKVGNEISLVEADLRVGQTPRELVWKKNKASLWYYPASKKTYKIPLFLVYSLINESYILDLYPGMSMIEAFLENGYDVYLLDFGKPGYEDSALTLDDYITKYIKRSVTRAIDHSGVNELTMIGFCLGGTLAVIYTAIEPEPVKNLVLIATPIDFEHSPVLKNWIKALRRDEGKLDNLIDEYGVIPAKLVELGMRMAISPFTYSSYFSLLQRANDERSVLKWRLFNKWIKGHIPFAGATLKQFINELGKKNNLVKNQLDINGKNVHLNKVQSNLLVIATSEDQIVSETLIKPIMPLVASKDKTYERIEGGHVSIAMTGKLPIVLAEWLSKRSELL